MSALDVLRACVAAWNDHQADVIAAFTMPGHAGFRRWERSKDAMR